MSAKTAGYIIVRDASSAIVAVARHPQAADMLASIHGGLAAPCSVYPAAPRLLAMAQMIGDVEWRLSEGMAHFVATRSGANRRYTFAVSPTGYERSTLADDPCQGRRQVWWAMTPKERAACEQIACVEEVRWVDAFSDTRL